VAFGSPLSLLPSLPPPHLPHAIQVESVLQLWPVALSNTPLLLELTRLLANCLPHCPEARLAAATLTGATMPPQAQQGVCEWQLTTSLCRTKRVTQPGILSVASHH
jgi:hypothetical protein